MELYLIPTTHGYEGDMDTLFMIIYGGYSYLQIYNNGELSFYASKWPINFISLSESKHQMFFKATSL